MSETTYTLVEYMPEHLRASHEAAGNCGSYPDNGAVRVWVRGDVDEDLLDPEWAEVVRNSSERPDEYGELPLEAHRRVGSDDELEGE